MIGMNIYSESERARSYIPRYFAFEVVYYNKQINEQNLGFKMKMNLFTNLFHLTT